MAENRNGNVEIGGIRNGGDGRRGFSIWDCRFAIGRSGGDLAVGHAGDVAGQVADLAYRRGV
jgi:hypothetical protein